MADIDKSLSMPVQLSESCHLYKYVWGETPALCNNSGILPPHPWMIKQQKLSRLLSEAITQLFDDWSDSKDRNTYSSSHQKPFSILVSSQFDLVPEVNLMCAQDASERTYGGAQSFLGLGDALINLSTLSSTDNSVIGQLDNCGSADVPFYPTDFGTSQTHFNYITTAATSAAAQRCQHSPQQTLPSSTATLASDDRSRCSSNQIAKPAASPLLTNLTLASPGTPVRAQTTEKDTASSANKPALLLSNDETDETRYRQLSDGGQRRQRRARISGSGRGIGLHRGGSYYTVESRNQRRRKETRQRPTHEGCSTIRYNFNRTVVDKTRKYRCDVEGCAKAYKKSCNLRDHKTTHSAVRPFSCSETGCSQSFHRLDQLRRHATTHSGEKPFCCPFCQKRFSRSDHVTQHRNRIHRES